MWRKYRDREKIAEVCNEGTAIKDNQRDESFIHEVGRAGLATLSHPCLLRTIPLPPASISRSLSFYELSSDAKHGSTPVGAGRFGAQENDFRRREKAISREYETRELSRVVHLRAKRIESFVFESSFTAQRHFCKENIYYDFLYVSRKAGSVHLASFDRFN